MAHCDHQSPTGDVVSDLRLARMVNGIGEYRVVSRQEKPRTHLLEYRARGDVLKVVFRSCGPIRVRRIIVSAPVVSSVDIITSISRRDVKQGRIVGIWLWGVSDVIQDYKKPSISIECLIRRFDRYHKGRESVFGGYKYQLLVLAREYQLEWWIPK